MRPQTQPCATRTFIAYATERERSAFEIPDQGLWQGVFTRCLLTILRRSPHGIRAADLKRALEYEVASSGQQAHVINGLREDSRFGRRGVLPRLVITFARARGHVWLSNSSRAIIAEREIGDEPWELLLDAGLYKLEDKYGKTIAFDHGGEAVTCVDF